MTAQEYIENRLALLSQIPSVSDPKASISDRIFKLLMSKKFRKYSVTPSYQEHIRLAIEAEVSKNQPINLTFVFGGYKLWRLDESPEVDWAELFSLIYFSRWLIPITRIYPPGIWFDFYSDDVILEKMNNIPKSDTNKYQTSFSELLDYFHQFIPNNLKFALHRVGDQYSSYSEFLSELASNRQKLVSSLPGGLPEITPERRALVDMNVKLLPGQDQDSQWQEQVLLIHDAYAQASKRRPYYRTPEKIMVVNVPIKDSLAVGTTKTSVVKFWIGAGGLDPVGDSYRENIYSPTQLQSGLFKKEKLNLPGLTGKNFTRIRVSLSKIDNPSSTRS